MRYWLLALAIAGAACGGGQGTPFCNEPAPVLANLDISPDNADVGSHGGQVAVIDFVDGCSTTKIIEKIQKK